ncbi:Protein tyrosine kinase Protein kinase domain [Trypanosoma vivax]|nr:casein kinase I isoform alpha [Trypanosoma vivax]KAH8605729.1 Protein tyrosine kinase Protein kinase domain [Trypanosoma vivax]
MHTNTSQIPTTAALADDLAVSTSASNISSTKGLSSQKSSSSRQITLADGKLALLSRIGNGAFGELYVGVDSRTNTKVAVKMEKRCVQHPQLSYENKVYRFLHNGANEVVGIPRVFYYLSEGNYNVLAMELCGPSPEDLFNYCGRRFSVKTVCMLAHQMIQRIEYVHGKGLIHRDIKPENFVFGEGRKAHILNIIDFGLSKPFWDRRRQAHIPFCEGKPLTGTARYCSTWTHCGYEQSRRDDMESIGFILVYFLNGSLPWQGVMVRDPMLKTAKIGEKKNSIPLTELCKGLPEEMLKYCTYCRELGFTDLPDYEYLRGLFLQMARKHAVQQDKPSALQSDKSSIASPDSATHEYDWMFDWFVKREEEVRKGTGQRPSDKNSRYNAERSMMGASSSYISARNF